MDFDFITSANKFIDGVLKNYITDPTVRGQATLELSTKANDLRANLAKTLLGTADHEIEERRIAARDFTPKALSFIVTVGFFLILASIMFVPLPANGAGHDVLLVMLGALCTAWTVIIGFYFASSSGDAQKTDALVKKSVT